MKKAKAKAKKASTKRLNGGAPKKNVYREGSRVAKAYQIWRAMRGKPRDEVVAAMKKGAKIADSTSGSWFSMFGARS